MGELGEEVDIIDLIAQKLRKELHGDITPHIHYNTIESRLELVFEGAKAPITYLNTIFRDLGLPRNCIAFAQDSTGMVEEAEIHGSPIQLLCYIDPDNSFINAVSDDQSLLADKISKLLKPKIKKTNFSVDFAEEGHLILLTENETTAFLLETALYRCLGDRSRYSANLYDPFGQFSVSVHCEHIPDLVSSLQKGSSQILHT